MKCRNCGLPRSAHRPAESGGRKVWLCPNDSGATFPAMVDYAVELHYRASDDSPWIAKWSHSTMGNGEVAAALPGEALERAGLAIEATFEEKSPEQKAMEEHAKR